MEPTGVSSFQDWKTKKTDSEAERVWEAILNMLRAYSGPCALEPVTTYRTFPSSEAWEVRVGDQEAERLLAIAKILGLLCERVADRVEGDGPNAARLRFPKASLQISQLKELFAALSDKASLHVAFDRLADTIARNDHSPAGKSCKVRTHRNLEWFHWIMDPIPKPIARELAALLRTPDFPGVSRQRIYMDERQEKWRFQDNVTLTAAAIDLLAKQLEERIKSRSARDRAAMLWRPSQTER